MSILNEYLQILTDPAHTMAEVTYDLLVWFLLSFIVKRWIRREHKTLDTEHGVEHVQKVWTDPEVVDDRGTIVQHLVEEPIPEWKGSTGGRITRRVPWREESW